jgi:hypothetical protein
MDFNQQAEEIAAVLVKSTLVHKDKELACAGLLYESLKKRFGEKENDAKSSVGAANFH